MAQGISKLDPTATTDNGCCIVARYVTYAFADAQDRNQLQIGLARVLFPYALADWEGRGSVTFTMLPENLLTPFPFTQIPFTLSSPSLDDANVPLNVTGNRAFVQIESSEECTNWQLRRIDMGIMDDPRIIVSGR